MTSGLDPTIEPYVGDQRIGVLYDRLTASVIALPSRWFTDAVRYLEALVASDTFAELLHRVPETYSAVILDWIDQLEAAYEVDLNAPIPARAFASFTELVEHLPPTPNMLVHEWLPPDLARRFVRLESSFDGPQGFIKHDDMEPLCDALSASGFTIENADGDWLRMINAIDRIAVRTIDGRGGDRRSPARGGQA